jgi:hypothetical protein
VGFRASDSLRPAKADQVERRMREQRRRLEVVKAKARVYDR